jgi:hypothetical protein
MASNIRQNSTLLFYVEHYQFISLDFLYSAFKFVFYIQVCILFKFVFYIRVFILFECSYFILHSSLYFIQVCILSNRNPIASRFRGRKYGGYSMTMEDIQCDMQYVLNTVHDVVSAIVQPCNLSKVRSRTCCGFPFYEITAILAIGLRLDRVQS